MDQDSTTRPRVLAVASCGGHWTQLQRLAAAWEECDVAYASVGADRADDVAGHRFHDIPDCSRDSLVALMRSVFGIARVVWREKPDVVVSTGAAPGLIALAAGRLFGARTAWIDSVANADRLSLSGRIARTFTHVTLTQWEHLASGKTRYEGAVL